MNAFDFIPRELLTPPVAAGQRFDTWKRFALYCAPLSMLFAGLLTLFLYYLWQAIQSGGAWLWVLATGLLCGGDAGLLWSLQNALWAEHARNDTLMQVYQQNHVVIRAQIKNLQIGELNIQAKRGSAVSIGGDVATEAPALAKFKRHYAEFYELVTQGQRDVNRDSWLAHDAADGHKMPAVQFRDGERISREEYDAFCDLLSTQGHLDGRKKGYKGDVKRKTAPLLESELSTK